MRVLLQGDLNRKFALQLNGNYLSKVEPVAWTNKLDDAYLFDNTDDAEEVKRAAGGSLVSVLVI